MFFIGYYRPDGREGTGSTAIRNSILHDTPPAPRQLDPTIPIHVDAACMPAPGKISQCPLSERRRASPGLGRPDLAGVAVLPCLRSADWRPSTVLPWLWNQSAVANPGQSHLPGLWSPRRSWPDMPELWACFQRQQPPALFPQRLDRGTGFPHPRGHLFSRPFSAFAGRLAHLQKPALHGRHQRHRLSPGRRQHQQDPGGRPTGRPPRCSSIPASKSRSRGIPRSITRNDLRRSNHAHHLHQMPSR